MSMVLSTAVVLAIVTTLTACTTMNYYLPKPESVDDTLLLIRVEAISNSTVEYRLVLDDGTRIRVFPKYPLTSVRGLPPGEHRAVRVESGKPGGRFHLQPAEIDVAFTIVPGEITVFPAIFAVEWRKTQSPRRMVTESQRCSFINMGDADLGAVRTLLERSQRYRHWEEFPFAPFTPSMVPESTYLEWKNSYIAKR
jgi:hypothetical protein